MSMGNGEPGNRIWVRWAIIGVSVIGALLGGYWIGMALFGQQGPPAQVSLATVEPTRGLRPTFTPTLPPTATPQAPATVPATSPATNTVAVVAGISTTSTPTLPPPPAATETATYAPPPTWTPQPTATEPPPPAATATPIPTDTPVVTDTPDAGAPTDIPASDILAPDALPPDGSSPTDDASDDAKGGVFAAGKDGAIVFVQGPGKKTKERYNPAKGGGGVPVNYCGQ